ncbi:ribosomal protein S6 kinase-related protein-like [Saccoglossus kowalevskii]|uniref:RAC family serine/threonine-protein kinase homolog n=1 Tax=Saccoglossus kowalevskii TaxID=10224 RepID=A0ABM0MM80_SACKO|nr:PREDICTED: RAC family serine/threonine-protein kinase homolog [Saccoglossus kowalevskii]
MGNRQGRVWGYTERGKLSRSVSEPEAFERIWARTSRRRPRSSTLTNPYAASLTKWPVPQVESLFLPEYVVRHNMAVTDFEILYPLSRGGFGQVLKVQKVEDKKFYAMKIISKGDVIKNDIVKQCKQEALIQSVLCRHPFIITAMYMWQTRTHLFLVTDYLDHGDLFTLWAMEHYFTEDIVRIYAAELALALDFLHTSGVVYRDLKMENVLLDDEGHIKLTDFGLARWLSRGHRASTICGTMQYMAPEALNPKQPYSYTVDWWSLGIVMYAMLTGKYPVECSGSHLDMYQKIMDCKYDLPNNISIAARNIVKGLLAKDPARRLQHIDILKRQEFFQLLSFDGVLEKRLSPKTMLQRKNKARRTLSTPDLSSNSRQRKKNTNRYSAATRMEESMNTMIKNFDWVNPLFTDL